MSDIKWRKFGIKIIIYNIKKEKIWDKYILYGIKMKSLVWRRRNFGEKTFWRKFEQVWYVSMSLIEKLNFDVQYSDSQVPVRNELCPYIATVLIIISITYLSICRQKFVQILKSYIFLHWSLSIIITYH